MTVVIAVALTGTFVGLGAGMATAVTGGLLALRLWVAPSLANNPDEIYPLIGFSIIAIVLLTTSQLYRTQANHNLRAQVRAAEKDAETAELFARELAHRMKNALAIVQALAVQTLPNDENQAAFTSRLRAMAGAHDLLTEHVAMPKAKAAEVVSHTLAPFLSSTTRLELCCDDRIILSSQEVVSMSLALHELATNACKYGAWHAEGRGKVSINIEDDEEIVRFCWKEHDGPSVEVQSRRGFGTKLLSRVGERPMISFEPDGLRFTTEFHATHSHD